MKGISLQISKETNRNEVPDIIEILKERGWTIDNIETF